jgi:hypothetical protein
MPIEPLNPDLYKKLQKQCGQVSVISPGLKLQWMPNAIASLHDGEPRQRLVQAGEEYCVNCPRCGDTRRRLSINHQWGVKDPVTGSLNLWLMNCYNEGCFSEYDRRKQFYDGLELLGPDAALEQLREGREESLEIVQQAPPGVTVPLHQLAVDTPYHPAIQYLYSRGFDPLQLSRQYGVSYCKQSHYPLACNRIIIPIYQDGLYAGWQARYIGDAPKGTPKYWNCPGMPKRIMAYNYDTAVKSTSLIVLVEGVTGVWKLGKFAMAVFGKSLYPRFLDRLKRQLQHEDHDPLLVVMLDPLQDEKAKQKGLPHHIERVYTQLADRDYFGDRVLKVYLPPELDPGEADRSFMLDLIGNEARKAGKEIRIRRTAPC